MKQFYDIGARLFWFFAWRTFYYIDFAIAAYYFLYNAKRVVVYKSFTLKFHNWEWRYAYRKNSKYLTCTPR